MPVALPVAFNTTITIGDIIIIILLFVLVKKIGYGLTRYIEDVFAEASWILPLIKYLNEEGKLADISKEIVRELLKKRLITKEELVNALATLIAQQNIGGKEDERRK